MLLFWNKKFALEVEVERKIVESRELDLAQASMSRRVSVDVYGNRAPSYVGCTGANAVSYPS